MAQWQRTRLPVQETRVRSVGQEFPPALEQLSLRTTAVEPVPQSPGATVAEP